MIALISRVVLGALLVAATGFDLWSRRIPNALCVAIFGCGLVTAALLPGAPTLASSIGAFLAAFVAAALAWRLRLCGGGDAKLAAAAATWVGLAGLPAFAAAAALAGGALSLVCYALSAAAARRAIRANLVAASALGPLAIPGGWAEGRVSVPYGAAIAAGALYAVLGRLT